MEMRPDRPGAGRFTFLLVLLVVIAAAMGALTFITLRAAVGADEKTRSALVRLAWFSFALLGLTLVALFWAVVRQSLLIRRQEQATGSMEYVDVWAEAGKRIEVEALNEDDEDSGDDPE